MLYSALAMSGSIYPTMMQRRPEEFALKIGRNAGCTQADTEEVVKCLKEVSPGTLLDATDASGRLHETYEAWAGCQWQLMRKFAARTLYNIRSFYLPHTQTSFRLCYITDGSRFRIRF